MLQFEADNTQPSAENGAVWAEHSTKLEKGFFTSHFRQLFILQYEL